MLRVRLHPAWLTRQSSELTCNCMPAALGRPCSADSCRRPLAGMAARTHGSVAGGAPELGMLAPAAGMAALAMLLGATGAHAGVRGAAGPAYWRALLRGAPAGPPAMFAAVLAASRADAHAQGRLAGGWPALVGGPPSSGPAPAGTSGQAGSGMGSLAARGAGHTAHGGGLASAAELEAAIAGVVAELVGARVAPDAPLAGQGSPRWSCAGSSRRPHTLSMSIPAQHSCLSGYWMQGYGAFACWPSQGGAGCFTRARCVRVQGQRMHLPCLKQLGEPPQHRQHAGATCSSHPSAGFPPCDAGPCSAGHAGTGDPRSAMPGPARAWVSNDTGLSRQRC